MAVLDKAGHEVAEPAPHHAAVDMIAENSVLMKQEQRPTPCSTVTQIRLVFSNTLRAALRYPELWFWSTIIPTILIIMAMAVIFNQDSITGNSLPRMFLSPGVYGEFRAFGGCDKVTTTCRTYTYIYVYTYIYNYTRAPICLLRRRRRHTSRAYLYAYL